MAQCPAFKETNRLRILRRYVAGYGCLIAGIIGLVELGTGEDIGWRKVLLHVLLVIAGVCNLLTSKAPAK